MARTCESKLDFKRELPNLLMSTTYALNKSNSKRVCVGLEHRNGYYHQVVKIINSGSFNKHLTLEESDWKSLSNEFNMISAYFENSYSFFHEYNNPSKVFLSNYDISFTTSYGTKSISIDERPKVSREYQDEDDTQNVSSGEPSVKKIKIQAQPPGVVMQHTTFNGLKNVSGLVDLHLERLREAVGKVNRTNDLIFEFLKKQLESEDAENMRTTLNNYKLFKQFYYIHNASLEAFVMQTIITDSIDFFKTLYLPVVFKEICTFDLPLIFKDLRAILFVE